MQTATVLSEKNNAQIIPMLRVRLDRNTVLTLKSLEELYHYRKRYPKLKVLAR